MTSVKSFSYILVIIMYCQNLQLWRSSKNLKPLLRINLRSFSNDKDNPDDGEEGKRAGKKLNPGQYGPIKSDNALNEKDRAHEGNYFYKDDLEKLRKLKKGIDKVEKVTEKIFNDENNKK
ncbi:unnamed protein product [Brassicogethes aeneus]|uniref:Uncharacterized protein n=1 Tax=Brassicogethes aeneus TaxID=1431903 RepID=A0A9P0B0I0_BRAAE|nr:unnamed protein product [Brassicogethes aeneus]